MKKDLFFIVTKYAYEFQDGKIKLEYEIFDFIFELKDQLMMYQIQALKLEKKVLNDNVFQNRKYQLLKLKNNFFEMEQQNDVEYELLKLELEDKNLIIQRLENKIRELENNIEILECDALRYENLHLRHKIQEYKRNAHFNTGGLILEHFFTKLNEENEKKSNSNL